MLLIAFQMKIVHIVLSKSKTASSFVQFVSVVQGLTCAKAMLITTIEKLHVYKVTLRNDCARAHRDK